MDRGGYRMALCGVDDFELLCASAETPAIVGMIDAQKAVAFLNGQPSSGKAAVPVEEYATQHALLDGKEVFFLYTTANPPSNN